MQNIEYILNHNTAFLEKPFKCRMSEIFTTQITNYGNVKKKQGAETNFSKLKVQSFRKPKYKRHEFITKKEEERQERI